MKDWRQSLIRILEVYVPADLEGEGEPRPFLGRGDMERRSFPEGLVEWSGWRGCLRGGVADILFTAFFGERDLEELLPEDEAERERLLEGSRGRVTIVTDMQWQDRRDGAHRLSVIDSRDHLPADGRAPVSVSGTLGASSGGAPAARGHSPPGTGPSAGGVRPGRQTPYNKKVRTLHG